ncbi:MAG: class I SAM-dependent methyltransferase [Pseudomonadota bacterium]
MSSHADSMLPFGSPLPQVECPACGAAQNQPVFYTQSSIPTHSCLLVDTADEAHSHPSGTLELSFCEVCGYIYNRRFEALELTYRPGYEDQQRFSRRFNQTSEELVSHLARTYSLSGGIVLEIGCGKGDFLLDLCKLSKARGIGIDPAWECDRTIYSETSQVEFIADYFRQSTFSRIPHSDHIALVCCRHTLEHIHKPLEFLRELRSSLRLGTSVFFQVPDAGRVFDKAAFEDVYYEHCGYFTSESLQRLFKRVGFEPTSIYKMHDDQYLCLEARAVATSDMEIQDSPAAYELARTQTFAAAVNDRRLGWLKRFTGWEQQGKTIALLGSGSKCVAFLSLITDTQKRPQCIKSIVDINPYRSGRYAPSIEIPISQPNSLSLTKPDVVVAMNSAYREEIQIQLEELEVTAELLTL